MESETEVRIFTVKVHTNTVIIITSIRKMENEKKKEEDNEGIKNISQNEEE